MSPILFNYNKSSKETLLDLINCTNGTTVSNADFETLDISKPRSIGQLDTEVILSGSSTSRFSGTTYVNYKRLSLNDFFFGTPVIIKSDVTITAEVVSEAMRVRGVFIDPEDMELSVVTFATGVSKVLVKALEDSYVWVGEFTVYVSPVGYIGDLFDFYPLDYNVNDYRTNAYHYSMEQTFTPMGDELLSILPLEKVFFTDTVENRLLVDYLTLTTGDSWTISPDESPFNLQDSTVVFNEVVVYPEQNTYTVVIKLSTKCSNLSNLLVIEWPVV